METPTSNNITRPIVEGTEDYVNFIKDLGMSFNSSVRVAKDILTDPNGNNTPTTIIGFNNYIIRKLVRGEIKPESDLIMPDLIRINNLGLTTLESKPFSISPYIFDNKFFRCQRAFLNGIYPRHKVSKLVKSLYQINNKIVVSETVFHQNSEDDHINLYNFSRDRVPIIDGLYPMICINNVAEEKWITEKSGNITKPMNRDYFLCLSPKLVSEITSMYSLIQIWSQNIDDYIFSDIRQALSTLNIYSY